MAERRIVDLPQLQRLATATRVLIPVAGPDRPALEALRAAMTLGPVPIQFVHVCARQDIAAALSRWNEVPTLAELPLEIVTAESIVGGVVEAVDRLLASGAEHVVVLVAEKVYRWRLAALLHDRTADAITRRCGPDPRVDVLRVAVSI